MSEYGSPPPPPYGALPPGSWPQPGGPPPPNYLVWAILSTLCCCPPLGIPAIVFASQVNAKWQGGDFDGARDASRKARTFAIWTTVVGFVWGLLVGAFYVNLYLNAAGSSL